MENFGILRGHSRVRVDGSGRLKLPAVFARPMVESYGREVFFTSVTGDFGLVYPLKVWEEIEKKLLLAPSMFPSVKKYLALTSYYGKVEALDSKDRLLIPQVLRETALLEGELIILGKLNHLEVWNLERFRREIEAHPFTDEDAQRLAELGI